MDRSLHKRIRDSSLSRFVDRMVTQEAAERLLDTPRLRSDMTHLSEALRCWILRTNRLDTTHQTLTHNLHKKREERRPKVATKDNVIPFRVAATFA